MIIKEYYDTRPDGVVLERTYSDQNFKIQSVETGAIYDDAIDPQELNRQYTETDIPIETIELPEE